MRLLPVGLSACVFAFDPAGRVLLVQSKDRLDTWEPPGGVVEAGEDPAEGAVREALEETGLLVALTGCTGAYFNAAGRLCLAFVGSAAGLPRPSAETPKAAWFTIDQATATIARPNLALRWRDVLAVRAGAPAGFASYRTRPFELLRRIAAEHASGDAPARPGDSRA